MFESKRLAHIKEWVDPENESNIIVSKKRDPFFLKHFGDLLEMTLKD